VIEPAGYYHAKAKAPISLGQALCDRFGGEVPDTLEELVTLPGVGRKTANVVLGEAFGKPGVVVDTHVARLARRFGWTAQTDPEKIERDIATLLPQARVDRGFPPAHLAWSSCLSRPQASVRRVWGGPVVSVVRRGSDRRGDCAQARQDGTVFVTGARMAGPGYTVGFHEDVAPFEGCTSRAGGLCPRPVRARDSVGRRGRGCARGR
jgi:hypothetical protein